MSVSHAQAKRCEQNEGSRGERTRVSVRRGFTILEVMLASMLGLLVVLTAIGLFSSIQISSRRSEETYERRMELALTQEAIERAMRGFIMSSQPSSRQPPAPGNNTPASARNANRTAGADEGAVAREETPPPGRPRVILEPDSRSRDSMVWTGTDGRARYVTPQRLEVTLTRPPVFAVPTREELIEASLLAQSDSRALTQRGSARRSIDRDADREERRAARRRSSAGESARDSAGRSAITPGRRSAGSGSDREGGNLEDLARRAGFDAGAVNRGRGAGEAAAADAADAAEAADAADAAEAIEEEEEGEPALAPGIRGVFEVQWDRDDPSRAKPGDLLSPDGGTWSLWWREIEVDEVDAMNEVSRAGEGLSAAERRQLLEERLGLDSPRRGRVQLVSKLQTCRWEVVRRGETLSEFRAYFQEDLPAYFTLELQALSGQWMKWMFEVDWTRGDEPGMPIGGDPSENTGAVPVLDSLPIIGNPPRGSGGRANEATGERTRGGTDR